MKRVRSLQLVAVVAAAFCLAVPLTREPAACRPSGATFTPSVEVLEDRTVLSSFTVLSNGRADYLPAPHTTAAKNDREFSDA